VYGTLSLSGEVSIMKIGQIRVEWERTEKGKFEHVTFPVFTPGNAILKFADGLIEAGYVPIISTLEVKKVQLSHTNLKIIGPYVNY
jgi:hypothetical protein